MSKGVVSLAVILSLVHLLNFLNYTKISEYFDPPMTRSALLVAASLLILARSAGNLGLHFRRSWDMYAVCAVAIVSAAMSFDTSRTLIYSMWLTLAVYLATELSVRVRTPQDVVASLGIVLLPASFLVGIVNVTLGPVVDVTARRFGALGSHHVDTAYAMNYVCLFLALKVIPAPEAALPNWLRVPMLALLAWALYQVVFGLTRSVWLGVTLSGTLYFLRAKFNVRTLALTLFGSFALAIVISSMGLDRIVPDAVRDRIEVTEERYESGQIDPRIEGIRGALGMAMERPQGMGYATWDSHNSYLNILVQLGWVGFLLAMVAVLRSVLMAWRMGLQWFLFFSIGAAALLIHAFFEVQNTPGQANFLPLITWYVVSRARFLAMPSRPVRVKPQFVDV